MDNLNEHLSSLSVQSQPSSSSSSSALPLAVILRYLAEYHPTSHALSVLRQELAQTELPPIESIPDLVALLDEHQKTIQLSSNATTSDSLPYPSLPGPSNLPHRILQTHSHLSASNLLSISSITLPIRRFETRPTDGSDPRFITTFKPCLAVTAADKRVLFFDSQDGEILSTLEPVKTPSEMGHTAPVLEMCQHPVEKRELVTIGMDGKIILWDLLQGGSVHQEVIGAHARFVTRCQWSSSGVWLATAGYDKKINVFKRAVETPARTTDVDMDEEEEDDLEVAPLTSRLDLVQTLTTKKNPEAICFVEHRAKTYLAWSQREDCFLHYLEIPSDSSATEWPQHHFNTNETASDEHVSYSILSLQLHPTLPLLTALTGASSSPYSLILLLPFLSRARARVLHTNVPSSETYLPRMAWNQDGSALWITTEDGRLRLYDASDVERCVLAAHGLLAEGDGDTMSGEERALRWRMGSANGLIKDLTVLPDGTVASTGFDRTVRVVVPVDA